MISKPNATQISLAGAPKMPAELCSVVIHKLIPGYESRKLEPSIATKELATKRQKEFFKSDLMVILASIHVENFWWHFDWIRPN